MVSKRESYEGMISKLEDTVSSMENGEMTLEKTMENYEAGVALCNKLYKYLNEAEGKIKILSGDKEENFPGNEE